MLNYILESHNMLPHTPSTDLNALAGQLKALAEPKRLLILDLLMQGVQCNCEMGDKLQMAPNLISHHLAILRQANLVKMERDPADERWIYYSINPETIEQIKNALNGFLDLSRLQSCDVPCCTPRLERLKRAV